MKLPNNVLTVFDILENNGFECYLIGGCVRDMLLNKTPKDYDFTTNAHPEVIEQIFSNTIPTGKEFGTITVKICEDYFEITTYRADSDYQDGRHPSKVNFSNSLENDISRRDFTINSIAYNPKKGYVDYCNGISDIENKLIRCVGNPKERFLEDAIRILRGLRFSLRYDFDIEKETLASINFFAPMLKNISTERIYKEIKEIILNPNFKTRLNDIYPVLKIIFPYLDEKIIDNYPISEKYLLDEENEFVLRLISILQFIPINTSNNSDFLLQNLILDDLKLDKKIRKKSGNLLLDSYLLKKFFSNKKLTYIDLKLLLSNLGKDRLILACAYLYFNGDDIFLEYINEINNILKEKDLCLTLKDLKITGKDVMSFGYSGKTVGIILNNALENVIKEKLINNKKELNEFIKNWN